MDYDSDESDVENEEELVFTRAPEALKKYVATQLRNLKNFGLAKMKESCSVVIPAPDPFMLNLKDNGNSWNDEAFNYCDIAGK